MTQQSDLLNSDDYLSDIASDLSDDDSFPENSHESSSENHSESESDIKEGVDLTSLFTAKNQMVWADKPFTQPIGSTAQNIIRSRPGPTRYAISRCSDIKSAFLLFFPPPVLKIIIENTNKFGKNKHTGKWTDIDEDTFHAYIAILLLAGVCRAKNKDVHGLFHATFGRPIFRAIMSEEKLVIRVALRFDDVANRRSQRSNDKFSPIRELWNHWEELLSMMYNCNENVTIDEQLVAFKGRCSFRQFMPSKLAKYGLKFWLAVDSKTAYVWKIQPYLGKGANEAPERNQGQRVVLDLVNGLQGQKLTTDNFFTSYELGQNLLERKLTRRHSSKK